MFGTSDELIYLFGDSITQQGFDPENQGWVASLSHAYSRKLSVVNAGLSGYSTDQALEILPQILPNPSQAKIKLLVIFFGANDARLPATGEPGSPEQHVPLPEYRENLKKIVTHEKVKEHAPRIVLVTPPPVCEYMLGSPVRRTAEVTAEYAQAVRMVCKELDIQCLDIWTLFMQSVNWKSGEPLVGKRDGAHRDADGVGGSSGLEKLLIDGLHLRDAGNRLLFECLMRSMLKEWPELDPEKLLFRLPYWGDVNSWKAIMEERTKVAAAQRLGGSC